MKNLADCMVAAGQKCYQNCSQLIPPKFADTFQCLQNARTTTLTSTETCLANNGYDLASHTCVFPKFEGLSGRLAQAFDHAKELFEHTRDMTSHAMPTAPMGMCQQSGPSGAPVSGFMPPPPPPPPSPMDKRFQVLGNGFQLPPPPFAGGPVTGGSVPPVPNTGAGHPLAAFMQCHMSCAGAEEQACFNNCQQEDVNLLAEAFHKYQANAGPSQAARKTCADQLCANNPMKDCKLPADTSTSGSTTGTTGGN
jgi:hypothetical protein